jgi:DNA-binding NarL/FixJ family response regulator
VIPSPSNRPIRILIADGENLFRTGLASLLATDKDIEVVGLAAEPEDVLRHCVVSLPNLVLLDIRMPGGTDLIRQLRLQAANLKVLVLTSLNGDAHVLAAMRAGASGYILKSSPAVAVASAIRVASATDMNVMSGVVADTLLGLITGERKSRDSYDGLTPREVEVLRMIASGVAYKQVALRLSLSHKTVRGYASRIYEKLALSDRSQMVLYAVRKGLVEP